MKVIGALFFLWLFVSPALALEITSISPSTTFPGALVRVSGGPFDDETLVLLGDQSLRPETWTERELIFTVPDLPEGDYRLTLGDRRGGNQPAFILRVGTPRPEIRALEPERLDLCAAGGERRISVSGQSLAVGARLLLDGAQLPAERLSANRIDFTLPDLAAGMHQVEVVNPDGQRSLPYALMIDGQPEIFSVTLGTDQVVAYELIIQGRNFPAQANLLVNGAPVNRALALAGKQGGGRDEVRYIDCGTLIYTRYPLSREPLPLTLTVVGPGGEGSAPYQITSP
jgi:hypothetical protein